MAQDTDRLESAIGKMGSTNENEAATAFRFATRLLAERGITWADVSRLVAASKAPAAPTPAATPMGAAFGDIFSGIFGDMARPAAEPFRPAPRPAPRVTTGSELPEQLFATVSIDDERTARNDEPYLVVTVRNDEIVCSPLMVFDTAAIAAIRAAGSEPLRLAITRPRQERHNAVIRTASPI